VTAEEVLAEVLRQGGEVVPDPTRPRLLVPPALKPLVLEHREALRALLFDRAVTALVSMPLDQYGREGAPLEIRVSWSSVTLWFVPDARHAESLMAEGISRGRIWTARELMDLMSCSEPAQAAHVLALVKLELDGEVVEVRPR
jgi:hypothetical protein